MFATKLFVCGLLLLADPSRWREDLRFLSEELEARHANLYHTISRAELQRELAVLEKKLPQLDDDQIVLEIARILTRVGDGHTGIFLPWSRGLTYRKVPLRLYRAADGWLILAASADYAHLAGAHVLKIGDTSIDDVVSALLPFVPHDNEFGHRFDIDQYVLIPEVLRTLGFIESADEVPLTVEDASGKLSGVSIRPVDRAATIEWRYQRPKAELPTWMRNLDQKYWSEYLPDTKTLYVQFNSADIQRGDPERQFAAFADSVVRDVEQKDVDRLILDLRWNAGGSFYRTRYLLRALIRSEKVNQPGKLFVFIGPRTFSAGTSLATEIDAHTEAIFVGEPTGGRPNGFGDLGRIRMLNSNIEIRYSRYYEQMSFSEDRRPAIFPDLRAAATIAEVRQGRDPAFEAVANYSARRPVTDEIATVLDRDGVAKAIEAYHGLKAKHFNEFEFGEGQLDSLGHRLLREKKVDDAVAIFTLNAAEYRWAAHVWSSLGQALLEKGERGPALEAYKRAFELDKRYTRYRDLLRE